MQELDKNIENMYGITVKNLLSYKDGYHVFASSGRYFARKVSLRPERLMFVHGAKEHLAGAGLTNTDRYIITTEGIPYFEMDGAIYTLSAAVEGRECDFDERADLKESAILLANMHNKSKGYNPPENARVQDELGKLPHVLSKRLDELRKLKKIAAKGKSVFDAIFLANVDRFLRTGEEATQMFSGPEYVRLSEETVNDKSFCHHDYTYSNIIFAQPGISAINFEYCCRELKVYDIANFIRRKMRKCNWSVEEARFMIEMYQSAGNLGKDDFCILGIMLRFPQKFWRTSNRYYNSRRSLLDRNLLAKLKESIEEAKPHESFIKSYHRIFL